MSVHGAAAEIKLLYSRVADSYRNSNAAITDVNSVKQGKTRTIDRQSSQRNTVRFRRQRLLCEYAEKKRNKARNKFRSKRKEKGSHRSLNVNREN